MTRLVVLLLLIAAPAAGQVRTEVVADTLRVAVPVPVRTRVVRDTVYVSRVDTLRINPKAAPESSAVPGWVPPALAGAAIAALAAVTVCKARGSGRASIAVAVGESSDDCDDKHRGKGHDKHGR